MRKRTRRVGIALTVLALAWCVLALASRLPSDDARQLSRVVPAADTRIGRGIAALPMVPGTSGIHSIPIPLEAFATRVRLIRAADRTLDLQYYIWNADTTGTLLLGEVLKAAERGVHVRLLVDDNGTSGMDELLRALDAHPNAEVRLFNPFTLRAFKPAGYLVDFPRLNRRMHNKSLTADGVATIVGGRNIGDRYFDSDPLIAFVDLDVLVVGKAAADVDRQFDLFWNSEHARTAASILGAAREGEVESLSRTLTAANAAPSSARYMQAVDRVEAIDQLVSGELPFEWSPALLIHDPPAKTGGKATESQLLLTQLTALIGRPERELDVISPYFVPGERGAAALCDIARSGAKLRIITNSLAANDVVPVHAGYAKGRRSLLACGIHLYELKPVATLADDARVARASWQRPGSSKASLHGKIFSMDRTRAFVGSFNLDPRSVNLNTEMGLVIDDPGLAGRISTTLDQRLASGAYEVRLRKDGELEWLDNAGPRPIVHREEPGETASQRWEVRVLSLLPIESLL